MVGVGWRQDVRQLLAICAALVLAACTTTSARIATTEAIGSPPPNARVLLVQPDVQLSVLTAAGLQEPRADWSRQGREDLAADLKTAMGAKTHPFATLDPQASLEGRAGQLLRLHDAVGASIAAFNYGYLKLPTKRGAFDWTLGEGARALGEEKNADYALFVTARGAYASAGRKAVMVGAALLGVGVQLGSQTIYASLVDLRTGRVVWFNVAIAGPSADIRTAEGSKSLVGSLLKGVPL